MTESFRLSDDHQTAKALLRIGGWRVDPASSQISRDGDVARLEVRTMRLLLCLAEHAGDVVSIDHLISHVWGGVAVAPDSVYQAVTSLRRQLGDDSRQPAYIETVPRLGYRLIAAVAPWHDSPGEAIAMAVTAESRADAENTVPSSRWIRHIVWATIAVAAAVIFGFVLHARFASGHRSPTTAAAAPPQASVGVLPFLDLTEGMHNEEFADGMTEELIDKLSKVQGLSVPSATSSFYYKGKQLPVGEIALRSMWPSCSTEACASREVACGLRRDSCELRTATWFGLKRMTAHPAISFGYRTILPAKLRKR